MKIRTITTGVNLSYPAEASIINRIAEFNSRARKVFEDRGYEVQSLRITTQPWVEYLGTLSQSQIIGEVKNIENMCLNNGIDFVSVGAVTDLKLIDLIPEIIKATSKISASVTIGDVTAGINYEAAKRAAKVVMRISQETDDGYGNFRFAALSNCPPDIPFFPASYHKGKTCFSIGLECSDLVSQAFEKSKNLVEAEKNLKSIFTSELIKVEQTAKEIEKQEGISFKGIDASTAPSLQENEGMAFAFEKLNLARFGAPGTLAISGMITRVLKSLDVQKCGYSGLMLPILEDFGLATRCSEGLLSTDTILLYSAVCGTGLDCIPLPGNISERKIYSILLDIATLSLKLDKPLSARLLPVPNKEAGETTCFNSPYLVNCKILQVK